MYLLIREVKWFGGDFLNWCWIMLMVFLYKWWRWDILDRSRLLFFWRCLFLLEIFKGVVGVGLGSCCCGCCGGGGCGMMCMGIGDGSGDEMGDFYVWFLIEVDGDNDWFCWVVDLEVFGVGCNVFCWCILYSRCFFFCWKKLLVNFYWFGIIFWKFCLYYFRNEKNWFSYKGFRFENM